MAAAGHKRFVVALFQLTCQFTASSTQHVPGKLRTQAFVELLAGGGAKLLQNKKTQSSQTRGQKRNIPGFGCPFVDP